jgi:uncharacterized protein YegJ (DUF2314 family)
MACLLHNLLKHLRIFMAFILVAMISAQLGCEDGDSRLTESTPAAALPESPWRVGEVNGERSARLPIERDDLRKELEAAAERAQQTVNEAREQWRKTPESQRHRWAVKWAAPVAEDENAVEHVWVRPMHWSHFRIEGALLSAPDRSLDAAGSSGDSPTRGDIVSFPVEELSDWVRWHADNANAERDGGFTIDVLEQAAGPVR